MVTMTYSITPSANGIITVAKGNKIVITGYEAKSAVIGSVEKKCISISKTGTLKAKKNIFRGRMIIRYSLKKKMYLYDIIDIKKET